MKNKHLNTGAFYSEFKRVIDRVVELLSIFICSSLSLNIEVIKTQKMIFKYKRKHLNGEKTQILC